MRLSDGLILSGYPVRSCRKLDSKAKAALTTNDEMLCTSLQIVVNAGCLANCAQVELLKGALANNAYPSGLAATAEHILSTISNPNWIDRELLRQFFLERAGLGSELSLRCASLCVERGVPSPQRLATLFHPQAEPPGWLRLTDEDEALLRIALASFIEVQCKHLTTFGKADKSFDPVWADVDSESESESDSESSSDTNPLGDRARTWLPESLHDAEQSVITTETGRGGRSGDGTAPSGDTRNCKAPPPTPSKSPRDPVLSESADGTVEYLHSLFSTSSAPCDDCCCGCCDGPTHEVPVEAAAQAWPFSLALPSALQSEESSPDEQSGSEGRDGGEGEGEVEVEVEVEGDMSSYGSCSGSYSCSYSYCSCSFVFEPSAATVEGYLTRSTSAHSLQNGNEQEEEALRADQVSMTSYGSLELAPSADLSPASPLTASATSSVTDRDASLDLDCLYGLFHPSLSGAAPKTLLALSEAVVPLRSAEEY